MKQIEKMEFKVSYLIALCQGIANNQMRLAEMIKGDKDKKTFVEFGNITVNDTVKTLQRLKKNIDSGVE